MSAKNKIHQSRWRTIWNKSGALGMIPRTKMFHIGDVLTATRENLVSPRGIDGVRDILAFLTGANEWPYNHQLGRIMRQCEPNLREQFPFLMDPRVDFALAELKLMLESPSGKQEPQKLLLGWLSKLTSGKYGIHIPEMLEVSELKHGTVTMIDPIFEAQVKFGLENVLVVRT